MQGCRKLRGTFEYILSEIVECYNLLLYKSIYMYTVYLSAYTINILTREIIYIYIYTSPCSMPRLTSPAHHATSFSYILEVRSAPGEQVASFMRSTIDVGEGCAYCCNQHEGFSRFKVQDHPYCQPHFGFKKKHAHLMGIFSKPIPFARWIAISKYSWLGEGSFLISTPNAISGK